MSLKSVEPSARFDVVAFDNVVKDGRAASLFARYTCARCGEGVGFTKEQFEERAEEGFSNLPADISRLIAAWAVDRGLAAEPFLDWVCPGCGLAVRAYARKWAGGRHGDAGTDIVAVVEVATETLSE